jgi:hypothetical protein
MHKGDIPGAVIIVGLIIGIAAFFVFASQAPVRIYAPVEIPGSTLSVSQPTNESAVMIAATLKQAGFVTVHQAIGEAPGPLIGQSDLLPPGTYTDITLNMLGALSADNDFYFLVFVDDGNGVYDPGIDLPVMSDGQVIKQKLSL